MSRERLILGTAQLGLEYGIANRSGLPSEGEARRLLEAAEAEGVRGLDCAPAYGMAEARIGAFVRIRGGRPPFEVATKVASLPGGIPTDWVPELVEQGLDASLERLGLERVQTLLVHDVADLGSHGGALRAALEREVERGRVARLGVSVYEPEELELLPEGEAWSVVQLPLSLLDQRFAQGRLLTSLRNVGVEVHARSVLLQGLLTLEPEELAPPQEAAREPLRRLRAILADWSLQPAEIAIAFALELGASRVVIGAEAPEQLRASGEASERRLEPELVAALREAFAEVPRAAIDPRAW